MERTPGSEANVLFVSSPASAANVISVAACVLVYCALGVMCCGPGGRRPSRLGDGEPASSVHLQRRPWSSHGELTLTTDHTSAVGSALTMLVDEEFYKQWLDSLFDGDTTHGGLLLLLFRSWREASGGANK